MKRKVQWRPQEVEDAGNVKCLWRKTTGSKWNQPKRKGPWVATGKAIGRGCLCLLEFISHHHVLRTCSTCPV